jgi:hypothetical protein
METTRWIATNQSSLWSITVFFWKGDPFIHISHWKMNVQAPQFNISTRGKGLKAPKGIFLASTYLYGLICKVDKDIFLDA